MFSVISIENEINLLKTHFFLSIAIFSKTNFIGNKCRARCEMFVRFFFPFFFLKNSIFHHVSYTGIGKDTWVKVSTLNTTHLSKVPVAHLTVSMITINRAQSAVQSKLILLRYPILTTKLKSNFTLHQKPWQLAAHLKLVLFILRVFFQVWRPILTN